MNVIFRRWHIAYSRSTMGNITLMQPRSGALNQGALGVFPSATQLELWQVRILVNAFTTIRSNHEGFLFIRHRLLKHLRLKNHRISCERARSSAGVWGLRRSTVLQSGNISSHGFSSHLASELTLNHCSSYNCRARFLHFCIKYILLKKSSIIFFSRCRIIIPPNRKFVSKVRFECSL